MNNFSSRMIKKYGEAKWAEMVSKSNRKNEVVIIKGSDLLNHSLASLIMTGTSYDGALDKIKV